MSSEIVEKEDFLVCVTQYMQVAYELKDAGGNIGMGIFVTRAVMKGTMIWQYSAGINVKVYDAETAASHIEKLATRAEARKFLDLTFGLKDLLHEITDEGRFMNHSEKPNCRTDENLGHTYASRDIDAGEQLFEDYTTFDHPDFLHDLLDKYQCAPEYYPLPKRDNLEIARRGTCENVGFGVENMNPDVYINGSKVDEEAYTSLNLNLQVLADSV